MPTPPNRSHNQGDPHRLDREERWNEIIRAAASGFYERGYEGTSLQEVADAVGLLKGSIYYYIKTKEDLLFELVVRAQKIALESLAEDDDLARSPAPVRLRAFIDRWMQLKERERDWLIVAEREFQRLTTDRLDAVKANRRRISTFVEEIIAQGVAEGTFDATLDVSQCAAMVFELMKSSHLHRRPNSRLSLADHSAAYADFALRGLGSTLDR